MLNNCWSILRDFSRALVDSISCLSVGLGAVDYAIIFSNKFLKSTFRLFIVTSRKLRSMGNRSLWYIRTRSIDRLLLVKLAFLSSHSHSPSPKIFILLVFYVYWKLPNWCLELIFIMPKKRHGLVLSISNKFERLGFMRWKNSRHNLPNYASEVW